MTHSGKFQWNVLPFGISIGVQTFSFVMNKAIGKCSDFAANYLDIWIWIYCVLLLEMTHVNLAHSLWLITKSKLLDLTI